MLSQTMPFSDLFLATSHTHSLVWSVYHSMHVVDLLSYVSSMIQGISLSGKKHLVGKIIQVSKVFRVFGQVLSVPALFTASIISIFPQIFLFLRLYSLSAFSFSNSSSSTICETTPSTGT